MIEVDDNGRIPYPGLKHGDTVRLTGRSWREAGFHPGEVHEVDDETFHRPVIWDKGKHWFIMEKSAHWDFSVTKVENT